MYTYICYVIFNIYRFHTTALIPIRDVADGTRATGLREAATTEALRLCVESPAAPTGAHSRNLERLAQRFIEQVFRQKILLYFFRL